MHPLGYVILAAAWINTAIVALIFGFAFADFRPLSMVTLAGVFVCAGFALKGRAR